MHIYDIPTREPDYEARNIPLAIYGTLMTGESNHGLMESLEAKDHASLQSADCRISNACIVKMGNLPSLYFTPNGRQSTTVAELWFVSSTALDILDVFEGHPTFYHRTDARLVTDTGGAVMAVVYRGPSLEIETVTVLSKHVRDGTASVSDWRDRDKTGNTCDAPMSTNLLVELPPPPNAPALPATRANPLGGRAIRNLQYVAAPVVPDMGFADGVLAEAPDDMDDDMEVEVEF
jgi:gamma-glutamylcyclotransferase (GGCT)/AIG2-like uncharacterized protein YtfP